MAAKMWIIIQAHLYKVGPGDLLKKLKIEYCTT